MPTIKDNAVCVRLMDWSETSQVVVIMTQTHGKISAVAKGAKRQTPSTLAKFSGGVELLTAGEAVLIVKPSSELANLIEWNLVDAHWHLRQNFRGFELGMYAADLVHHLVHDHDPHEGTFEALRGFLRELGDGPMQAALIRFGWALVVDLGYKPVLEADAQTGESLDEEASTLAFSAAAGGLVADTGAADRWRVRRQTVDVLRAVEAGAPLADFDEAALRRANQLMCVYFRAILDKQLPTMEAVLKLETRNSKLE
jgi:DNA repair protein RecO (recombination protein O)